MLVYVCNTYMVELCILEVMAMPTCVVEMATSSAVDASKLYLSSRMSSPMMACPLPMMILPSTDAPRITHAYPASWRDISLEHSNNE
jgi:hypothetical protein